MSVEDVFGILPYFSKFRHEDEDVFGDSPHFLKTNLFARFQIWSLLYFEEVKGARSQIKFFGDSRFDVSYAVFDRLVVAQRRYTTVFLHRRPGVRFKF